MNTTTKTAFNQFAGKKKDTARVNQNGCLIYTRVSSGRQEEGASLETQLEFCHDLVRKHKLNILAYFGGGKSESAKTDERTEFKKMLEFAKRNKQVGYIVIYAYSRFSRTGGSAMGIIDQLKAMGVYIISATQEVDAKTSTGTLQEGIQMVFSRYDNDQRTENCINGMKTKLRNGYVSGNIPIGYTNMNPGKRKQPVLKINKEGELIREAFLLKANHDLSYNEITERLKKKGWPRDAKRLSEIFRNPFYCGIIVSTLIPGEVIKTDKHPALISEEVFLKVNGILRQKRTLGYKYNRDEENLPLKQFLRSASDNTPFTGYIVKRKGLYYYKNNTKGSKENKSAKQMHEAFKALLSEYVLSDSSMVEPIKKLMIEMCMEMQQESIEQAVKLESEVSKIEKNLDTIERRFVLGEINGDLYNKYYEEFQLELVRTKEELVKSSFDLSNLETAVDKALDYALKLPSLWESGDLEEKRRIQNMVFPSGLVYDFQKGEYRTDEVNSLFSFIPIFTRVSAEKQNGTVDKNYLLSRLVPKTGLEPAHLTAPPPEDGVSTISPLGHPAYKNNRFPD